MSYRIKLTGEVRSYRGWGKEATRKNPIIEVDTEEAVKEAVASGYFVALDKKPTQATEVLTEVAESDKPVLTAEQLSTMKFDDLKEYAESVGIDVAGIRKKTELVAAIVAAEAEYADNDDDEEVPDGIFG